MIISTVEKLREHMQNVDPKHEDVPVVVLHNLMYNVLSQTGENYEN